MPQNGYLELVEQRNELLKPTYNGVRAAKVRIHLLNRQISQIQRNPKLFDPSFVHQKPGYTSSVLNILVGNSRYGSIVCQKDLVDYSNWIIEQRSFNHSNISRSINDSEFFGKCL